jgi:undecaprenyl-diphosphatase
MTPEWMAPLLAWLETNPGWLAITLLAVSFVESLAIAGVVVPGVALLFGAALLAGKTGMPLPEALLWAGLGAVAGDGISFALGRQFTGRLHRVWPFSRYPGMITSGERFFRRHGGKSVIIGRFIGPIRPVIPLIAGALMMPWKRFLVFNIGSAIGWAPVYILPGYLVGSALALQFKPPPHFYAVLGVSLGALALVYLLLFRVQLRLGSRGRIYQWLQRRMARYTTTHKFWRLYSSERPDRSGEFPLTSYSMALGAGALFLIWTLLATQGTLQRFNELASDWFLALRHPVLDPAFVIITLAGDPPVLIVGTTLAIIGLTFRGYYAAAIHCLVAAFITVAAIWGLKQLTGISRPDLVNLPPQSGAFPSGHTAGTTVFFAMAAAFIAREYRGHHRWQIYLLLSLPMLLAGLSRLYLGVHWFTDVVGGLLLGLAITAAVRASYSRYDRIHLGLDSSSLILSGAGLVWLLWYLDNNFAEAMVRYTPAS